MRIRSGILFLTIAAAFALGSGALVAAAQDMPMKMPMPSPTATPKPSPMPMEMPMNMPMPSPTPDFSNRPKPPVPPYPPPKDWDNPVEDERRYTFLFADLFEFSPKGGDSEFRWDAEGWYGDDHNRFWVKSEGEKSSLNSDLNADFQLLYARFVRRFYDFQIGGRVQTLTTNGSNATRVQAVVGIEGLRPYNYEIEAAAFIDPKGNVSGRFTATKDLFVTQRWILQPRFETNLAIQKVQRFKTGGGLNDIETGLRLRYEIRREFAPYFGISYRRSFFDAADFIRRDGGNPSQLRIVTGVRVFY